MEKVIWLDSYNTGIEEIDNQHRQIVDYMNQLSVAYLKNDMNAVGEVLEGLVDYTMSHFAFEESLIEEAEYPMANAHKKIHEMFILRLEKLRIAFKAGEAVTEEFYSLLKRWLIQHIQRDDMAYSSRVKAKLHLLTQEAPATSADNTPKGSWIARSLKKFFGT